VLYPLSYEGGVESALSLLHRGMIGKSPMDPCFGKAHPPNGVRLEREVSWREEPVSESRKRVFLGDLLTGHSRVELDWSGRPDSGESGHGMRD
jgi:hypothetical protein